MVIGERTIGPSNPYIIGEVALAHDGSLALAHSYIDAIADTGAHAVKFQMHTPRANAEWRVLPQWPQDEDRNAYWKRTSFSMLQWAGLKVHAERCGLDFLVSPFSIEAFGLIDKLGVPAWKVPSGKINDHEMLRRMRKTGLPMLLSTGMSPKHEIADAIDCLGRPNNLVVLQCSSLYPTPPAHVGINFMGDLRRFRAYCVGLSDHSGTVYPSLIALHEGASVIEVHVVLDRRMHGFDTSSSVTPAELEQIVDGAKFVSKMADVDKNDLGPYEEARRVFM
jgi:N-acetylneuraminate synthase